MENQILTLQRTMTEENNCAKSLIKVGSTLFSVNSFFVEKRNLADALFSAAMENLNQEAENQDFKRDAADNLMYNCRGS